jgi:hypothetical protein
MQHIEPAKNVWVARGDIHEIESGRLRISVHRYIHMPPDKWFTSCPELGYSARGLVSEDIALAKNEALIIALNKARGFVSDIEDMIGAKQ